jgi:hypothetical protein
MIKAQSSIEDTSRPFFTHAPESVANPAGAALSKSGAASLLPTLNVILIPTFLRVVGYASIPVGKQGAVTVKLLPTPPGN